MQIPVEHVGLRIQRMVDARKLLRVVEDVANVIDQSMCVQSSRDVSRAGRQRDVVEDVRDVRLRRRRNNPSGACETCGIGRACSRVGTRTNSHRRLGLRGARANP